MGLKYTLRTSRRKKKIIKKGKRENNQTKNLKTKRKLQRKMRYNSTGFSNSHNGLPALNLLSNTDLVLLKQNREYKEADKTNFMFELPRLI